MNTTKTINYRKALYDLIKQANIFSDIKVVYGNNVNIKRIMINDLDKPVLYICFAGGTLEKISQSQGPNSGYTDENNIYFFIFGRNNALQADDDFSLNNLELDEAKDMLIETVEKNKDYWKATNKDFNFLSYQYMYSSDFEDRNLNVLVIQANHKYKNL